MADSNDISTALAMIQEMLNNLVQNLDQMNSTRESNSRLEGILNELRNLRTTTQNQDNQRNNTNSQSGGQQPQSILNPVINSDPEIKELDGNVKSLIEAVKKNSSVLMDVDKEKQTSSKNFLDMAEDAGKVKDSLVKTAKSFRDIAIGATGILGFDKLMNAINPTVDSYRKMISAGNDFGGSLVKMREVASSSGLTLDHFTKAIANGSEGLRMLGPQTFAGLNKAVTDSIKNMGDLGMTPEERASYMNDFLEGLRTSGKLLTINSMNVNTAFRNMMTNVDDLSHTLGVSREEAMKMLNQTKSDPNIMIARRFLNQQQGENATFLDTSAQRAGPEVSNAIRDAIMSISTGRSMNTSTIREIQLQGINPDTFKNSIKEILDSTDVQQRNNRMSQFYDRMERLSNNRTTNEMAAIGSGPAGDFLNKMANMSAGWSILQQQTPGLRTAPTEPMGTHYSDRITKSAMHQADVSESNEIKLQNVFTTILKNQGDLLGHTITAYQNATSKLADVMENVGEGISNAFKNSPFQSAATGLMSSMEKHTGLLLVGMGALVVAMKGLGIAMSINRSRKLFGKRGSSRGSGSLAEKLFDKITGRGSVRGAEEAGTVLSRTSSIAGKVAPKIMTGLKVGGAVGTALSVADEGYNLYKWHEQVGAINKQQKEGKISQYDADRQKSQIQDRNIGQGAGMIIGGIAGSFVGPLGTAIGVSLGSYLGEKVGTMYSNISHPIDPTKTQEFINSHKLAAGHTPPPPVVIPKTKSNDKNDSQNPINGNPQNNPQNSAPPKQNNPNPPHVDKSLSDIYEQNHNGYNTITNRLNALIQSMDNMSRSIRQSGNVVRP